MPDNTAQIAELEELLNLGASSVNTDSMQASLDINAIRKRLRELKASNTAEGASNKRPIASTIDLSGG